MVSLYLNGSMTRVIFCTIMGQMKNHSGQIGTFQKIFSLLQTQYTQNGPLNHSHQAIYHPLTQLMKQFSNFQIKKIQQMNLIRLQRFSFMTNRHIKDLKINFNSLLQNQQQKKEFQEMFQEVEGQHLILNFLHLQINNNSSNKFKISKHFYKCNRKKDNKLSCGTS